MNEQLTLAVEALHFVRNHRVQSTNHLMQKQHVTGNHDYFASKLALVKRYDAFQARFLKARTSKNGQHAAAYGALVLLHRVGNCLELACACGQFLDSQQYRQHAIVYYPQNDHAFNVLGQPPSRDGIYPTHFAQWEPDSVIVDAWADIACFTRDYPVRWRARMQNWQIMGRSINSHQPVSPEWYNLVDQFKVVLTSWH